MGSFRRLEETVMEVGAQYGKQLGKKQAGWQRRMSSRCP